MKGKCRRVDSHVVQVWVSSEVAVVLLVSVDWVPSEDWSWLFQKGSSVLKPSSVLHNTPSAKKSIFLSKRKTMHHLARKILSEKKTFFLLKNIIIQNIICHQRLPKTWELGCKKGLWTAICCFSHFPTFIILVTSMDTMITHNDNDNYDDDYDYYLFLNSIMTFLIFFLSLF